MISNKHKEPISYLMIFIGISSAICWFFRTPLLCWDIAQKLDIAKVIISLYGTLLGFLFTFLAIVISLSSNRLIQRMVQSGHYENLIISSKYLATLYFISLVALIIGLFIYQTTPASFIVGIFLSLLTILYSVRTSYKFFQILTYI